MIDVKDPINLEIMWQRVIGIIEECWVTIWRTSFSVVVGEALDYGCVILDPRGRVLAHPWRSMPGFNFALPNTAKALLERYPAETLKRGDVLTTNDPWLGAGHLFDIAAMTPTFNRKDEVVAFIASMVHVADIGGTRARHTPREIYDEGLFIPPLKLYDAGRLNEELIEIIENNVRLSRMVVGDIHAMVSANQVGAERVKAFMEEYGLDDLEELTSETQGRTEQAMRKAITALPDGVYEADQWCDGIEEPFRYRLRVTVSGDSLEVDFVDVPDQFPYGATNATYSILMSHTNYALKCILAPGVPGNDGNFRPVTVKAPEGSVFNCKHPASVNQRTHTTWTVAPALMQSMAKVIPDKVRAHTGFPVSFKAYGRTRKGDAYNDHMFQSGGQGASSREDGQSTILFPTSAGNVSAEMFEMRTGFLVGEKEFIPDSGGAGKYRGAPGQRVTIRRRPNESGGQYALWAWPQALCYDIPGSFGGQPGSRMRLQKRTAPGAPVEEFFEGLLVDLDETTEFTLELPGGSGFGDPKERDPEAIRRDIEEGIVTPEGARAQYVWEDQAE